MEFWLILCQDFNNFYEGFIGVVSEEAEEVEEISSELGYLTEILL